MGISKSEAERFSILLGGARPDPVNDGDFSSLEHHSSELLRGFYRYCAFAGLSAKKQRTLMLRIGFWLILSIFGLFLTGRLFSIVLGIVALAIEYVILRSHIKARVKGFDQDYCAFLLSIASSVKSGADPILSMTQAIHLFPPQSVITQEVVNFKLDLEKGLTEEQSLKRFALSVSNPDIDMFRTAMIIARKEGSALGDCLQRLAKVTRQRQSFVRKVRSAVAMQRMASMGIAGCTVAIGLIQYFANPKAIQMAWSHPVGYPVMVSGMGLIIIGLIWMRRLAGREM